MLTWRLRETDERVVDPARPVVAGAQPIPKVEQGVPGTLGQIRLRVAGGFRPGYLYELICEAEGPIVQGLGFAATRDLISFLRYDDTATESAALPSGKPAIERTHGFGVSQSGRFLRHFLYQGFNADEHGRKVFDGLMPHVAGGGLGFFNHRFAQPTRHNGQHEEHLYPADIFPFTYGDSDRSVLANALTASCGARSRTNPKACCRRSCTRRPPRNTGTAAARWSTPTRWATKDADIPDNRCGSTPSAARSTARRPIRRPRHRRQPAQSRRLQAAACGRFSTPSTPGSSDGTAPPPSVYPRIDKGTLVGWRQKETRLSRAARRALSAK